MTSATENGTTRAYAWDCRNKLMCIVEGGVAIARYKYDGRGLRCQKTEGGQTVTFYYDGRTVSEEAVSGNMTALYAGPEKYIDEQWRVFHEDGLGSVRNVTSDTGSVTHLYVSDAYGVTQIHQPDDPNYLRNPYGFAGDYGYCYSKTTGLYLLQMRYYDPTNGRFISADPIGYRGGTNLYGYAKGKPTTYIDPTGKYDTDCNYCMAWWNDCMSEARDHLSECIRDTIGDSDVIGWEGFANCAAGCVIANIIDGEIGLLPCAAGCVIGFGVNLLARILIANAYCRGPYERFEGICNQACRDEERRQRERPGPCMFCPPRERGAQ
ncbi:MAG: RHS repeat-associated core domain-containing protein [Armatimonadota bacterium]|nr:RHS repeat-associated core domain-containing protein [Armatimonadota bacterium]